jgi:hypothetical protein
MRIDSFSGAAADLKGDKRTPENVLIALMRQSRVSVWDMDAAWLRSCLDALKRSGDIVEVEEPYPWLRFRVIPKVIGYDAGKPGEDLKT